MTEKKFEKVISTNYFLEKAILLITSEVFQIEISEGSVQWLGSCQNINLYPARVFTETRVFRSYKS